MPIPPISRLSVIGSGFPLIFENPDTIPHTGNLKGDIDTDIDQLISSIQIATALSKIALIRKKKLRSELNFRFWPFLSDAT